MHRAVFGINFLLHSVNRRNFFVIVGLTSLVTFWGYIIFLQTMQKVGHLLHFTYILGGHDIFGTIALDAHRHVPAVAAAAVVGPAVEEFVHKLSCDGCCDGV